MKNTPADFISQLPALSLANLGVAVLVLLLVTAAVIDYRTFRIPNWLTASGLVIGLVLNTLDAFRPLNGLVNALAGAAVGLAILLPLYALKVMGAGDVKLMSVVGAFLGLPQVIAAVLLVFITGGIGALVFALANKRMGRLASNLMTIFRGAAFSAVTGQPLTGMGPGASVGKLPYGVNISAGTLLYLAIRQFYL